MASRAGKASRARSSFSRRQATLNRQIVKRAEEEYAGQLRREIGRALQAAAIETMNGLSNAGPAWSGQFSASWRFVPEGASGGEPGPEGSVYRYTKNDLTITTVERYMKGGRTGPSTKLAEVTKFQIVNTAQHANLAIEGEVGNFRRDIAQSKGWPEPLKDPSRVSPYGLGLERDNPGYRYEIGPEFNGSFNESGSSMTAEQDWYITYTRGGKLDFDLKRGFEIGFSGRF